MYETPGTLMEAKEPFDHLNVTGHVHTNKWNDRFNSTMAMRADQRAMYHQIVNSCVLNMPQNQKIKEQQYQIHNLISTMS